MAGSGLLPARVYEGLFLLSFLTIPVMVYQAGLLLYVVTFLVMYIALWLVRKTSNKHGISPDGKSVFITGCDTGFGQAIALRLNNTGFRVFAGCLNPEGDGAKNLQSKCPNDMFVVPLDVTKQDSVEAAKTFVEDKLGNTVLWGLVNNAGVHCVGDVELTSLNTYKRVFDINVFGMLRVVKTFIPLVRKSKGRVVIMSSIAGFMRAPSYSCYDASKSALECLSDCLRMEMVKFGVHVSILQPASFGSNTNITVGDNLTVLYDEADHTWQDSSEDVRAVYGKNYTRSYIDALLHTHEHNSCSSVDPVVTATEDCLLSSNPLYRKVVHGGPHWIDVFATLAVLTKYLPESITDWLLCKATGHSDTSNLQGLKKAMIFKQNQK